MRTSKPISDPRAIGPETPYEYATWKQAKVSIDYHVEVERHYYSVPYGLVGERVDVRASALTIEVFARGRRVASHLRSTAPGRHTTETAHIAMPKARSGTRTPLAMAGSLPLP